MTPDIFFWLILIAVLAIGLEQECRRLIAATRAPWAPGKSDSDKSKEGDRAAEPERP